ncbi:sigma-54 interaction domain-containing protein [Clostridium aciditolerans]|uniref:HTH-type transcriptional regulatory protein TyrR n=1 Tax=Clostridium aciditolerans TaxID=339861 RepID=A0A934HWC7_9CLOT|nr:sigma 54-interacting transcriptional regulator [Clostridium aciditolerans]MBI6873184.1 sigma 54-interacting transcriptional regulator [Clostridium aciditolerans]
MKEKSEGMPYNKLLQELSYYKQTYEELKLIMDTTFDQITVTDGKGVLLKVSKSCQETFGISESEMIGKDVYELSKSGIFNPSITIEVLKKKKELSLIQETASGKRLLVTGIPMINEKGKLVRVVNISKDITESEMLKKQLEETEHLLDWYRDEIRRNQIKNKDYIVGNSTSMKKIIELVEHIGNIETTIILLGETGVGKSFIAKTIHQMSKRREQPFVQINCGAIPENLIESELFGYEEGAFTGAVKKGKKGLLEVAGEGTIFLDEIGELPMQLQVKLLHVLQEKQAYKIGSTEPFDIKARIISATNKDLKKLVREGKFREDLYYRLNIVPIHIPPLRERAEDIPLFINYFLSKCNQKYSLSKQISSNAYKVLSSYNWPGNIRELENIVERLVVTSNKNTIEENDIFDIFTHIPKYVGEVNEFIPLKIATEEFEKQILLKAIEKYKTTRKVADILKIDQSTVVKKLKKIKKESLNDYINHRF